MKLRMASWRLAAAAAGAIALCGIALAQNVPDQFVVSGKAAEKIHNFTTVNLATAERIANSCEKAATDQGVQISIMVLDNAGNHVYMDRMDGQGYLNIITAEMKARTALLGGEPSKIRMNRVIQDPNDEFQEIQLGIFANSGGLPIVVNKQMIGIVGVGGSAPHPPVWSDEICGHKALVEVFGASVPPLVEDLPPRRRLRSLPPPRRPRRPSLRNSWSAERAPRMYLTPIRFRSRPQRKLDEPAATGPQRRATPCRCMSSIMPASSYTWSAWTAKWPPICAPLF